MMTQEEFVHHFKLWFDPTDSTNDAYLSIPVSNALLVEKLNGIKCQFYQTIKPAKVRDIIVSEIDHIISNLLEKAKCWSLYIPLKIAYPHRKDYSTIEYQEYKYDNIDSMSYGNLYRFEDNFVQYICTVKPWCTNALPYTKITVAFPVTDGICSSVHLTEKECFISTKFLNNKEAKNRKYCLTIMNCIIALMKGLLGDIK